MSLSQQGADIRLAQKIQHIVADKTVISIILIRQPGGPVGLVHVNARGPGLESTSTQVHHGRA